MEKPTNAKEIERGNMTARPVNPLRPRDSFELKTALIVFT